MKHLLRLLAPAGCAALAACSVGPAYEPPATVAPAAWEAPAVAQAYWPPPRWWEAFSSAELSALMTTAIENNPDLDAALARILQAQAQAKAAAGVLYPSLSAGGNASRATSNGTSDPRYSYQGTLNAAYQVDLFGRNSASAAAAEVRSEISRYDAETVALTLKADVANTYFQILAIRDRTRLAEEQLRVAESLLDLIEAQARIGVASDLEVAQQRSAIASRRASVLGLQQTEVELRNALAVLLGRLPEGFRVQSASLDGLVLPGVGAGLPADLLEHRPDVRQAEASLRAANLDIAAAAAARLPSLQLTGSGGTASDALRHLFSPDTWLTSLAVGLTAPLFQGGQLEAQQEVAEARYKELAATYGGTVLSAFRDVENALSAIDYYGRQYAYTRVALDQAQEAYRLAQLRYRAGTVDFTTVLNAQQAVFQASDALVQADLPRYSAVVSLNQALGGGWPSPSLVASTPG